MVYYTRLDQKYKQAFFTIKEYHKKTHMQVSAYGEKKQLFQIHFNIFSTIISTTNPCF